MTTNELNYIKKKVPLVWKFMNTMECIPNAQDCTGETALIYAAGGGNNPAYAHAAFILSNNGWDWETRDIYGNSSLDHSIDGGAFHFAYRLLQQYDFSKPILENALYYALRLCRLGTLECDRVVLTLIEKLGGVTQERCPDALAFALGGRAVPYISALMAAGFEFDERTKKVHYKYFYPDFDSREILFSRFMNQKERITFKNRDDYPLYIENGILRARPELYRKAWPKLSRKTKIKFKTEKGPKLKTLNYIANWTNMV